MAAHGMGGRILVAGKIRRIRLFTVLLILLPVLSGCWDREEIEERTSVVALGLDKSNAGDGLLRLSAQIPIPKRIAGSGTNPGSGGGQDAVKVLSATGHTLSGASRNLQKRLNQELFYGHTRVIALSEELAREGVDTMIDALRRTPQIRRLLWPVIVKGDALKLLQMNPKLEQIPILFLMDLMENNSKLGIIPAVTLGRFYIDLSDSTVEPVMNVVKATKDGVRWEGLAVFRHDRMIGQLSPDEAFSFMQIKEEKTGGTFSLNCPSGKGNGKIVLAPKTIQTKKTFHREGGHITADISVRLEVDVIESQCRLDISSQKDIRLVEQAADKELENRANRLVSRLQKELKQDVLAFATDLRESHPEWWNEKTWDKIDFPHLKTNIKYHVFIRRTGMEVKRVEP